MVLVELFLFSISLALTFTVSFRIKHPFSRTCVSFIAATALSAVVFIDVRLAVIGVIIGFALVVLALRPHGLFPLIPAVLLAIIMITTPHADDLLYLQSRYADNFVYLSDGVYYAERLRHTILVSRQFGDTYQSYQFRDVILQTVENSVPSKCSVKNIVLEPTQTKSLFSTPQEYARVVQPTIVIYIYVPEEGELDTSMVPYNPVWVITV